MFLDKFTESRYIPVLRGCDKLSIFINNVGGAQSFIPPISPMNNFIIYLTRKFTKRFTIFNLLPIDIVEEGRMEGWILAR